MSRLLSGLLALLAASPLLAQVTTPARPDTAATLPAGFVEEFGTMWTLEAPPLDYWKARYGFTPDQTWLDHVRLASVRTPICSASFVSSRGLVMTNHHCARECISAVSPADTNFQRTGFVAATQAQERKCPGLYVDQLQSIEDVTAQVRGTATARGAAGRVEQRKASIDTITAKCQAETGFTCQVVALYNGGIYSLYRYKRFDDVRLVMAPEEEVSFFGGDPDNFTYPRYDLDMSFVRVYDKNAPLAPKDYLKWSARGAEEGDVVFVVGNPGSTGRLLTVAQMEYLRDVQYPAQLALLQRNIDAMQEMSEGNEDARRRLENQLFSAQNSFKAITGYLAGLQDSSIMAHKRAFERDFRRRVSADPKLREQYGGTWDSIAAAQRQLTTLSSRLRYYGFGGSQLLNLAGGVVRVPRQAALPDSLRLPQYRGEGLKTIRQLVERDVPIDPEVEKLTLAAQLRAAQRELPANDPFLRTVLAGRSPEVAAEALVNGTRLADTKVRKDLIEGGTAAVDASDDPMIVLARRLEPLSRSIAMQAARLDAVTSANAEQLGQAIFAAYGRSLPPDATFTLRISDGVAKSYPNNGTIAPYRTTFYGLYGRSAAFGNEPPFQLPERWRMREKRLDLSTPLDFVSTNDIIGGNSGSPVINREGEVVGLIFDGNIESLANRFIFTDEVARSVSVHSRGIVEALRKVYDATRIADELEGKPSVTRVSR